MDLKETDILGEDIDKHWYYAAKASATTRLLGDNIDGSVILDVGAGSGFFSRHLLRHSNAAEAWCVDISYKADSDSAETGKPVHYRRAVDAVDADLVLLMDVLEHVEDDVGLLTHYAEKVPRGARFLISVPAFQFLWSGHDDFLEHKRRYTLPQIEDVARRSGIVVEHGAYYFGFVFPIAAASRFSSRLLQSGSQLPRSQLKRHSRPVNGLLSSLCAVELPMLSVNRFAGLTAFCVAKKP